MNPLIPHDEARSIAVAVAVGSAPRSRKLQLLQLLAEKVSLAAVVPHISEAELRAARCVVEECTDRGIDIIPYTSERYPALLRTISLPPAALYVRSESGQFSFPAKMLSVVGTRAASVETCQRASLLTSQLASSGLCIVSGLALGVDGAAHRGALMATSSCATIAVLAHGLDRIYPSTHTPLADSILTKGGALISEYSPGTEPFKHHFLERNRIIAGVALGVVVIQAGDRSGSLVTANFAADFGRDVFVMEGADGDSGFCGGQRLIEDGAIPIASAREILEEYGFSNEVVDTCSVGAWRTLTIAEYLEQTGCSTSRMLRLEMEGKVVRLPGNRVSVSID